jgi:hypothetical protein
MYLFQGEVGGNTLGCENAYKILVVKPQGKKLLERPTHRCQDDIKLTSNKQGVKVKTGFICLKIRPNTWLS